MKRAARAAGLLLVVLCAAARAAGPLPAPPPAQYPPIAEIVFVGNDTTQVKVMRREMVIREGDMADPARIERSRQAIQDLGLFRSVVSSVTEVPGGTRVTFTVKEKFYLLPYPRLSANLDGQTSYGGEVRWNNVAGLNYALRAKFSLNNDKKAGRGTSTNYFLGASLPFLFDSPYSLDISGNHQVSPVTDGPVPYDETFDSAEAVVSRRLGGLGPASQGWTAGLGVNWQNENRQGVGVPAPYGMATALVVQADYYDIRDRIFSSEGESYGARVASAHTGLASDYNYTMLTAGYEKLMPVGELQHQDVNFFAQGGVFFDGPAEVKQFSLGGSGSLRARPPNYTSGNAYYLLRAEYLRPLWKPWLRGAAIFEVGDTFDHPRDLSFSHVQTSLGLALRVRFTMFVNFSLELGYAIPLNGGGGRFFGGRV